MLYVHPHKNLTHVPSQYLTNTALCISLTTTDDSSVTMGQFQQIKEPENDKYKTIAIMTKITV